MISSDLCYMNRERGCEVTFYVYRYTVLSNITITKQFNALYD